MRKKNLEATPWVGNSNSPSSPYIECSVANISNISFFSQIVQVANISEFFRSKFMLADIFLFFPDISNKFLFRPSTIYCYPRYLGITRRSCLEAHMVLDMEYREQERPEHGPGGPIFLLLSQLCPVSSTSLHHYRPGLVSERTLAP
jgi:hypothetical protein